MKRKQQKVKPNPKTYKNGVDQGHSIALLDPDKIEINFQVDTISDYSKELMISGHSIFFAMKTEETYLVTGTRKGLILVANNKQLFSSEFPGNNYDAITHVEFIDHLDAFLMFFDDGCVFRKDIDQKSPYSYFQLQFESVSDGMSVCFSYSRENQVLIIGTNFDTFSVLGLQKEPKITTKVSRFLGEEAVDLTLFGSMENKLAILTQDGYLLLYFLNFAIKKVCVFTYLKLISEGETCNEESTVAVCDNNTYLFVQIINQFERRSSRLIVLKNEQNSLIKKAVISHGGSVRISPGTLKFCGYLGKHIFWVNLVRGIAEECRLYQYDIEEEEIKEKEMKRISANKMPQGKLFEREGGFFYIGQNKTIQTLTLTAEIEV